jgi:hypothetical protein
MNNCLRDFLWKFLILFVDDIIIYSKSLEEHKLHLELVFKRLLEHGFQLKLSKCHFFKDKVTFLGFEIQEGKIRIGEEKMKPILNFAVPTTLKGLQRFLGMTGYYRRFVKNYGTIAAPLQELLKEDKSVVSQPGRGKSTNKQIQLNQAQLEAFEKLKKTLTEYPVMRLPDFDQPFILITDASNVATGAVLAQNFKGEELPVHYSSKATSATQRNKHSYYHEVLALVRGLEKHNHYLSHAPFLAVTDCRALSYFNTTKEIPPEVARWLSTISQYQIRFMHREGTQIPVPDALSRDEKFYKEETHKAKPFNPEELEKGKFQFTVAKDVAEGLIAMPTFTSYAESVTTPSPHFVQPEERQRIIKAMHDDPLAGHCGIDRTFQKLRERFTWEGMHADVKKYVQKCSCQMNKPTGKTKFVQMAVQKAKQILEWMQLDFIDFGKPSRHGNNHILVIVDRYSKWVEIIATQTKDMATVVRIFKERILHRLGCPKNILADNAFKGDFATFCDQNGINLEHSQAHQSNTNGLVERMNRTIQEYLRNYVDAKGDNWDELLSACQFAINTSVAKAHKQTPYLVMMGRDAVLPIQRIYEREQLKASGKEPEREPDEEIEETEIADVEEGPIVPGERPVSKSENVTRRKPRTENSEIQPQNLKGKEEARAEPNEVEPEVKTNNTETPEKVRKEILTQTNFIHQQVDQASEKYRAQMLKQESKGKKFENHAIGSWVTIADHNRETNLAPLKTGPWKVIAQDPSKPANYTLLFRGIPGSEIVKHNDDLKTVPGITDDDALSFEYVKFLEPDKQTVGYKRQTRVIREQYKLKATDKIEADQIVGKRVEVFWPKYSRYPNKGYEKGLVLCYEGKGSFWIKYDHLKDKNNTPYILEKLLSGKPPKWRFEGQETDLLR